jgi:hypothetical protein
MRRLSILLLSTAVTVVLYGCPSTTGPAADTPAEGTPPAAAVAGDVCPLISAGPPPVCPDGCVWNGKECRQREGIIMDNARDGGAPKE